MTALIIFWVSAVLITYAYLGYPALMYVLSRIHPRPWKKAETLPGISIIMAVHNGAALVSDQVQRLLTLDYPEDLVEVIVVSDGSTDATAGILDQIVDRRLHTVICADRQGKAAALNLGMELATRAVLLFVDIRPRIEQGAIRHLMSNFADPSVGCVAGELHLRRSNHDSGTKAVSSLYWRYEQWIRICESSTDSPTGVYGGFYAVRRELAVKLPAGLILDDMYQPLWVARQGYRSVIDVDAKVWDIWPEKSSGEFERKVRTLAGNYQLFTLAHWLFLSTNRLRWRLLAHKALRLVVPIFLVSLYLSSFAMRASGFFLAFFIAQSLFYCLALIGFVIELPFLRALTGPASAFCLLNAAAVAAPFRYFRYGRDLWKSWSTHTVGPSEGLQKGRAGIGMSKV